MPTNLQKRMLSAVKESYEQYKVFGPRSTKKLIPLHGWVSNEIRNKLNKDYVVRSVDSGKERQIIGKYYVKKVDVSVEFDGHVVGVVNIKFIISNYRQNANNYFENQLGETANLRRKNIAYGHLNLFTNPIPYFYKNGKIKSKERLNDDHIKKYSLLSDDCELLHSPDVQAICIFNVEGLTKKQSGKITSICEPKSARFLSPETKDVLQKRFGVDRFFDAFCKEVKAKEAMRF